MIETQEQKVARQKEFRRTTLCGRHIWETDTRTCYKCGIAEELTHAIMGTITTYKPEFTPASIISETTEGCYPVHKHQYIRTCISGRHSSSESLYG